MKPLVAAIAVMMVTRVWADIAPTEYYGGGIIPAGTPDIKMESANVEIVWGKPCTLSAKFVMQNASEKDQEAMLGFPMPAEGYDRPVASGTVKIAIDGAMAHLGEPLPGLTNRDQRKNWMWHWCKHSFVPGKTIVEVTATLRASSVYAGPYRECLRYCIETGGKWADTIGTENVAITFPAPIAREQIIEIKPAGAIIVGNRISWTFRNIEPKADEFDIEVTYVRPDLMAEITRLRNELNQHPKSSDPAIQLAKCLLMLGFAKSNSGFPPWRLNEQEFKKIAASISSEKERKIFVTHYVKKEDADIYEERDTEWTEERKSLIVILANAGYRDEESQIPFIREGETLLLDILKRDSHNAEAWNVYLANYWRFSFAAYGHWFGMSVLTEKQQRLIRQAFKNCPNDKCICLWNNMTAKQDLLRHEIRQNGYDRPNLPDDSPAPPSLPDEPQK